MRKLFALLILTIIPFLYSEPTGTYGNCKVATPNATRLKVVETEIVVNGKKSSVYEFVQESGSRIITKTEGECFNLIVENKTSVPTCQHWHGLILPVLEDGVPYVTQKAIPPGGSYSYNFEIVQSGTYWAHSHFGLQEQKLMAAPLIILPKEKDGYRDVVLFFEDFTFKTVKDIWLDLRKEFMEMVKVKGQNWQPDLTPPRGMHMPPDLNDVPYDAFLTNRKTLENPDIQLVKAGEKVRIRLINGSTSSNFHIYMGDLKGEIVAVDGHPVDPVSYSDFPMATAQRVDVLATIPEEGGIFPIYAQSQGSRMRTGGILKTAKAPMPQFSSLSKTTIGAITNAFEKNLHAKEPLKPRKVNRTITAELGGNMKYYVWSINDHVWPNIQPLMVKEGERVEMAFVNKTSMSHPMHLHGHAFQVVEIDGEKFSGAMRDTVLVMPSQTVKIQFDANNPGIWAMHCHISYHLWAGMFTVLLYEGFKPPFFSKQSIVDYSRRYGGY